MASKNDLYSNTKETLYAEVRNLASVDGYGWDKLSEDFCGFGGPSSLKNIINQDSHNLDSVRLMQMLKELSRVGNLRIHAETIDRTKWQITKRFPDVEATGDLDDALVKGTKCLVQADIAIRAGNALRAREEFRKLEAVMAKISAEINALHIKFKKLEE